MSPRLALPALESSPRVCTLQAWTSERPDVASAWNALGFRVDTLREASFRTSTDTASAIPFGGSGIGITEDTQEPGKQHGFSHKGS